MMKREREAWAIFGKRLQKPHLDKIMNTAAEAWGLLVDELWHAQVDKTPGAPVQELTIVQLRRLGYSCRKVKITWRDLRR